MDDALGCTFNYSYFYNTSNEVFLMLLFKSGDWFPSEKQIELTDSVCDFIHSKFDQFKGSTVEIHRKDLSDDGVFGWCELEESEFSPGVFHREFFIQIHNELSDEDYVITLIHELIHVKQTIDGLMDDDRREEEARIWEKILSKEYWDTIESVTRPIPVPA
tara:strand:+ start:195 stop:677 length:483 start_codon:yes stop_codon:yes gene_type:complete